MNVIKIAPQLKVREWRKALTKQKVRIELESKVQIPTSGPDAQ